MTGLWEREQGRSRTTGRSLRFASKRNLSRRASIERRHSSSPITNASATRKRPTTSSDPASVTRTDQRRTSTTRYRAISRESCGSADFRYDDEWAVVWEWTTPASPFVEDRARAICFPYALRLERSKIRYATQLSTTHRIASSDRSSLFYPIARSIPNASLARSFSVLQPFVSAAGHASCSPYAAAYSSCGRRTVDQEGAGRLF